MSSEVANAEEAAELTFEMDTDVYSRVGYGNLDPLEDSADATLLTNRLRKEVEKLDAFTHMASAHPAANRGNKRALRGWVWACEDYDNWQSFVEAVERIQADITDTAC